jgi:hypothetical protein
MEQKVKVFTLPCDGDLYKIFYTDSGEVICIRFFPLMETQYNEVEWKDLPAVVRSKFEDYYCK